MSNAISGALKGKHAVGVLYVGILAAAAGEIIPDPSDALYFHLEEKWRVELEKGLITPEEYWRLKSIAYFTLDFLWWMLIFVIAVSIKGDIKQKAVIVGAIVGAGALVGVIARNIQKDKEFFEKYKFVQKTKIST